MDIKNRIIHVPTLNKELFNRKNQIICDWDGVIQNIEFKWTSLFLKEAREAFISDEDFIKYFNVEEFYNKPMNKPLFFNFLIERKEYFLDKLLFKEELINSNKMFHYFLKLYKSIYIDDKEFYKDISINTAMGLMINYAIKGDQVVFCTKIADNNKKREKEEIFNFMHRRHAGDFLNIDDFKFDYVHDNYEKADYINEKYPNYDFIIDDDPIILTKLMETKTLEKRVGFVIPVYGYNRYILEDKEMVKKFENKNIELMYLDVLENLRIKLDEYIDDYE